MAADDTKSKKRKRTKAAVEEENADVVPQAEVSKKKKTQKTKTSKQEEESIEEVPAETKEVAEAEDVVKEDDQTAALLAGFESESDAEDPEEDINWDEDVAVPALTKSQRKALAKAESSPKSNELGVIYVGRVPRGFFEPQMKKYFSQFGKVRRLRLSRNKKTGASKHYAFVEFASAEVADIVARTMDNYLMFGHILKCKLIPAEQVHADLFKGANQRFKVDPRNKKAGLEMERGAPRAQWEKRVVRESHRRSKRADQLKEMFDYEYTTSELKSVDDVPKLTASADDAASQQLLAEAAEDHTAPVEQVEEKEDKLVIEPKGDSAVAQATQSSSEKKSKKASKKKAVDETVAEEEVVTEDVTDTKRKAKKAQTDATKPKKAKKAKA